MSTSFARAVAEELRGAIAALVPEGGEPSAGIDADALAALLTVPPNLELGDLALPCFRLAKPLGKAPAAVAAALDEHLRQHRAGRKPLEYRGRTLALEAIADSVATGPYLNLRIDLGWAAAKIAAPWARGDRPDFPSRGERVMVEFSQPNTHKAFHVGHMRNVCLGDALVRCLRTAGRDVVSANYLGDVGTHIAKCLWWYLDQLDEAGRRPPPTERGEWLGRIYTAAATAIEDLEAGAKAGDGAAASELTRVRARISEILRGLEQREPAITAIWRETRQWSLDDFDEIYRWCDVHFDRVFYESEVDEPSLRLVEEYLAKGVFIESEGAIGVALPEIKHMQFFMLRKSDGAGLYSAKDLALARLKFEEFGIDRSIYVVDSRQADHFRGVFLTLERMGFPQARRCEHVPYEMVELPDGPMSGRKGNIVLFSTLRAEVTKALFDAHFHRYADGGEKAQGAEVAAEEDIAQVESTWSAEEIGRATHEVALAAIKYGMLARDVNQKIVFDLQAWTEFDGNTGPYLQYVCARTASILRKASARGMPFDRHNLGRKAGDVADLLWLTSHLDHPAERALTFALDGLAGVIATVADKLRPSLLCTYLFELCKVYNRFQAECPVLRAEDPRRQARLMLVAATRATLAFGLTCLGIPAPERM